PKALESGISEHLADSRRIGKRRASDVKEEPIGRSGENLANERATQPPTTMSVPRATDEITVLAHQCQHVVDYQHRTRVIGDQNGYDVATRRGDTCANGVNDASSKLVMEQAQPRVFCLHLLHYGTAFVILRIMAHVRNPLLDIIRVHRLMLETEFVV